MKINPIIHAFISTPFMMASSQVAIMNVLAERYLSGTLTEDALPNNSIAYAAFKTQMNKDIIVGDYGSMDSEGGSCCPMLTTDGVLIFPITGTLMKGDSWYGPGTATMRNWIAQAAADVNVKSILFYVNCGGGEVSGTDELANDIANFSKPKEAFVDGYACSGAYYLICSCDKIYSSSPNNMFGSIGTACYIYDRAKYYAEAGILDRYVYADTSPQKHGDSRAIEADGNEQVMKDNMLNPIDKTFMDFVHKNRPQVSKNALEGLEVVASKAIADKTGLLDGIADFNTVYSQISPKKNTQMSKVKLSIDAGLVSNLVSLMPQVQVVTPEMETAELQAIQTKWNEATASLNTAQTKITELEGIVAANATTISNSEAKITELEAAVQTEKTAYASISAQLAGFTKPVVTPVAIAVEKVVETQAEGIAAEKVAYVKNPSTERKNIQYV